jgi:hypothetical protein
MVSWDLAKAERKIFLTEFGLKPVLNSISPPAKAGGN